tara:strand:+ start:127 stop:612 length:486 start_codon:yes stop_codon:yes gene_type:complete
LGKTEIDMSFRNIQGILDADVGDPLAKLVLLVINHHAHKDTMRAFPSIKTIALKSGLSDRTVIRKLEYLVTKKYLKRQRQGKNQVNIYTVGKCQPVTPEVTACHVGSVTVSHEPTINQPYNQGGTKIESTNTNSSGKKSYVFDSKGNRKENSFFYGINSKL